MEIYLKFPVLIVILVSLMNIRGCEAAVSRVKRLAVYCSTGGRYSRIDCGWPGILPTECLKLGCCSDTTHNDALHCFIPSGGSYTSSANCPDFSKPTHRTDCGFNGITKAQCENNGCCYDERVSGAVNCFHGKSSLKVTYSKSENHAQKGYAKAASRLFDDSTHTKYASANTDDSGFDAHAGVGHITANDENNFHSTLGVRAYANGNAFGTNVGAHAHLADLQGSGNSGWTSYGLSVGKVGASGFNTWGGAGVGVDATLAEAGGYVGKGPIGIGAKVGLSASTGVSTTKLKVLGTGLGFGSRGFELCFIGSCVYLG